MLELELNNLKKRSGIYIKKTIKYQRRNDLEKENCHVVIIDIVAADILRLICVYRSFRPQDLMSPIILFEKQLGIINYALTNNCFILGDFNLDASMENRPDYDRKLPLNMLNNFALEKNLIQIVTESTWSRVINGTKKESLLDHVYVRNVATVHSVCVKQQLFGDHKFVVVELILKSVNETKTVVLRNWRNYNNVTLCAKLASELEMSRNETDNLSVQDHWNLIELVLINTIDTVAPLVDFHSNPSCKKVAPRSIKNMINKRKRLLRHNQLNNSISNYAEIRTLNKEIKEYFVGLKVSSIRRVGLGNGANLWKAVKLAKNIVTSELPSNLTVGGAPVPVGGAANSFANYFSEKIRTNSSKTKVDFEGVYNGKCKLIVQDRNFMRVTDVKECIMNLPNKKCEGFDRIPVCMLRDTCDLLLSPLSSLFTKIYATGQIPDQWKVSKIIPIFKKGNKCEIENYVPHT